MLARHGITASKIQRGALVLGAVIGMTVGAASPAFAGTVKDFEDTATRTVTGPDGTKARLFVVSDTDHQAAYVDIISGSAAVQVRAECARRDGRTQWYQSTISVRAGGKQSHYDCDNNGTYNFEIVGLGVDFIE
jgi:hypothetical protein